MLVEFAFLAQLPVLHDLRWLVALAVVVGAAGRTPVSVQLVVVIFLLLFGLVRVNPGTAESFGRSFIETDETVRMKLTRSSLRVRAADAARYEALIGAVQVLAKDRTLWPVRMRRRCIF